MNGGCWYIVNGKRVPGTVGQPPKPQSKPKAKPKPKPTEKEG